MATDAAKSLAALVRVTRSLRNHVARGCTMANYRSLALIDRWNDARENLRNGSPEGAALFAQWCEAERIAPDATAYDFFA